MRLTVHVPPKPQTGFNDGMDVIKPLQGFGLRVYGPSFHAGVLKLRPVGLLDCLRSYYPKLSLFYSTTFHTKQ